jgi:hypothetical protein
MSIKLQNICNSGEKFNFKQIANDINNNNRFYLQDKTIDDLLKENNDALSSLTTINEKQKTELNMKLRNYRFVDEIYNLHRGKHVRWIRKTDDKCIIKIGGVVIDIKFLDNGTHVLIFNKYISKTPIQYKFDDVLTFQKLTVDEHLILFSQK